MVTTVVPSTLAEELAPKAPFATVVPMSYSSTSAIESSTSAVQQTDESSKLIEAMEEMYIKNIEINKLKEKIKNLEDAKKLAQNNAKNEEQKAKRASEQLKKVEEKLTLKEPMAFIKNQLWSKIIESINDTWPSIQVIYEQKEFLKVAKEEIVKTKEELGAKLEEALEIIKFLNTKNTQELDEIGITDRTETILEVRKVITKKNLMKQLEGKCQNMDLAITIFMVKFDILRQKGLPNILVLNDKLMKQEDYNNRI